MNNEIIFRWLALVLLVAGFGVSGYFRRQADRQGGSLSPEGKYLLIALRMLLLVFILPLLVYILAPQAVSWARLALPDWLRWLGAALAIVMIPSLCWVLLTIGNNISPTQGVREDHQLVRNGPYAWVRHPLYSAGLLFYLGISLMTGLWWLFLGLVIGGTVIVLRTRREEENLSAEFGKEYQEYVQETGRFIPRLRASR